VLEQRQDELLSDCRRVGIGRAELEIRGEERRIRIGAEIDVVLLPPRAAVPLERHRDRLADRAVGGDCEIGLSGGSA
jgi:hypothetical protein